MYISFSISEGFLTDFKVLQTTVSAFRMLPEKIWFHT